MIENMRKYTGLMVVVIILLAAGLILTMGTGANSSGRPTGAFMEVEGVSLDRNDFQKQGKNTFSVIQGLAMQAGYFQIFQFQQSLIGNPKTQSEMYGNFVSNRILLKQKAEELGIYASTAAAESFIQENMFRNNDGAFDQQAYDNFVKGIGQVGYKENDLKQLVAEYLVMLKTQQVVAGTLPAPADSTLALDKARGQKVELATIGFTLEHFAKDISPTDEEIKAFWEERKEKYQTDRQLKISYVLTLVDDSDRPQRPTPAPDATPDAARQQQLEYAQKLEEWNTARRAHTKLLTKIFIEFLNTTQDSEGLQFDAAAAKAKEQGGEDFQVVTTEAFSAINAPEALSKLMIKGQRSQPFVDRLFAHKVQDALEWRIFNEPVMPDGNIAVRIDEEIAPEVKSFEDAKELAKADLIEQRATEAMLAAAEKAQKTLQEALAAGKSLEDAAKENNLNVKTLPSITARQNVAGVSNAQDLFRIAQVTAPGTIAEEIATAGDNAEVVYVKSRVYEVTTDQVARDQQALSNASNELETLAFNAWLLSLRDSAKMTLPNFQ